MVNKKLVLSLSLLAMAGALCASDEDATRGHFLSSKPSMRPEAVRPQIDDDGDSFDIDSTDEKGWGDDDCSSLSLSKLCVKKLKVNKHAVIKKADFAKLCAKRAKIKHLHTEKHKTNELCAKHIRAEHIHANKIDTRDLCLNNIHANFGTFPQLCTDHISSNGICVNGNVEHCTQYKAYLSFSNATLYTLGADMDWDTIVDDPNGNVALGPTRYIVPKTGYYSVTFETGLKDLQGPAVIPGIPVVRLEIVVNGLLSLKGNTTFLSFGELQHSVISGVIRLNAGDDVRTRLRLFYLDPMTGAQPFLGTVVLDAVDLGVSQPNTETFFTIHYLSSDCPVECPPCTQIPCDIQEVSCPTIEIDCHQSPCTPCHPCHPHHGYHEHHDDEDEDND